MKTNFEEIPYIMTRREAQTILRVGKNTMLKFIHDELIPTKKIGNKFYILREDLLEFINNSVYC